MWWWFGSRSSLSCLSVVCVSALGPCSFHCASTARWDGPPSARNPHQPLSGKPRARADVLYVRACVSPPPCTFALAWVPDDVWCVCVCFVAFFLPVTSSLIHRLVCSFCFPRTRPPPSNGRSASGGLRVRGKRTVQATLAAPRRRSHRQRSKPCGFCHVSFGRVWSLFCFK